MVAGIFVSGLSEGSDALSVWGAVMMVAAGLPLLGIFFRECDLPATSGFMAMVFFFSTGCFLAQEKRRSVMVEWPAARSYEAVVNEWPRERARSRLLQITILDGKGSCLDGKKVYMYVPKDSASEALSPGDVILFYGRIGNPDNEGLETGFDYASYLLRKGVSGTLWVDARHWRKSEAGPVLNFHYRVMHWRRRILSRYSEWGFEGESLSVVSAVTIGYRDFVDERLRKTYSDSGAGHLLAVSGLHVGVIYAFLALLFPPFMNVGARRCVKELMVVGVLWCYVILTGLPVSAVRSLVMFSLLAVSRCTGRDGAPVNSLAVAAALILLHDPDSLYDIGFQLSFLAVFFIMLLQPVLSAPIRPENHVAGYVWDLVTVSLAAQLGTAPVVMCHFSSFSTYFLLANLLSVPMMFMIVSASVVMWLFCWIPFVRSFVVGVITLLVRSVNALLGMVAGLPGASMKAEVTDGWTVAVIYVVLLMLSFYVKDRKPRCAVAALGFVAVWCVAQTIRYCYLGQ